MSGIDLTVEPVGVGIAAGVDGDTLFPLNGFRGLFWLFAVVEVQVFYIHEVQRSAQNRSMMDDFAMSGEYAKSYV